MSWKDNRRRKRIWYQHYKSLCEQLKELVSGRQAGEGVAAEAIIRMFYDLYESRRMHKRRRVAESALESFKLAATDVGLDKIVLMPTTYNGNTPRPPARGGFSDTIRLPDGTDVDWKLGQQTVSFAGFPVPEITDAVREAVRTELTRRAEEWRDAGKRAEPEVPF